MQYGIEKFCRKCEAIGIDGLIIPDLPVDVYIDKYKSIFNNYNLANVLLITPQTSDDRIRQIDDISNSFIYMVSSASITGAKEGFGDQQTAYFKRIDNLKLKNPQIVGFGISNAQTFNQATQFSKGAIIGSAFIKALKQNGLNGIEDFVKGIRQ